MAWRSNASFDNLKILKSLDIRGAIIGPQAWGGFGDHYFLDSGTGTDGVGKGGTKGSPFATLDHALSQATDDNDDTLHILPNHSETITGAGGITLDKAGVSIRGYGRYDTRPEFLMDGAACSMLVTSANVGLDNCVFKSGHEDLAYFALVTGKGFHFTNNFVGENVAEENFVISISAGATDNDHDGLFVAGNEFIGVDTANSGCVVLNKDNLDVKILGNKIQGNFAATPYAPILMPDNEIPHNIEIAHNMIYNRHNDNVVTGISVLEAVGTGSIHHNFVYTLDVAGMTPILVGAGGVFAYENYYTTVVTSSPKLYPDALA